MTKQAAPLLSDLPAYPGRPAPPVFAEFLLGYDSHASLIYACLVPFLALDLAVTIYQWVCFPVYGAFLFPAAWRRTRLPDAGRKSRGVGMTSRRGNYGKLAFARSSSSSTLFRRKSE